MTTIFNTFKTQSRDKVAISTFSDACNKTNAYHSDYTISFAVYGPKNSGKTSLALALSQCPEIEVAPSFKTGTIQTVAIPPKAKAVKLQIFDVLDAPKCFMLTTCFAVIIDGESPNYNYVEKIAAEAFDYQKCIIVVSKTDLLSAEQLKAALFVAQRARELLSTKIADIHIITAKLDSESSKHWINSLLYEYYQYSRSVQLKNEYEESMKAVKQAGLFNDAQMQKCIIGSCKKREIKFEKSEIERLFNSNADKDLINEITATNVAKMEAPIFEQALTSGVDETSKVVVNNSFEGFAKVETDEEVRKHEGEQQLSQNASQKGTSDIEDKRAEQEEQISVQEDEPREENAPEVVQNEEIMEALDNEPDSEAGPSSQGDPTDKPSQEEQQQQHKKKNKKRS